MQGLEDSVHHPRNFASPTFRGLEAGIRVSRVLEKAVSIAKPWGAGSLVHGSSMTDEDDALSVIVSYQVKGADISSIETG